MNYYEILQIPITATPIEIKQAYRKLVKQFHPDSNHEKANDDHIILLNAAYEILSDEQHRRNYDRQLQLKYNSQSSVDYRQHKSDHASQYYQQNRQRQKQEEFSQFRWLKEVYFPVSHLIHAIISPLEMEIEDLSADVFDDRLMLVFTNYLDDCRQGLDKARNILMSQPNPSIYAGIAANLYYGLNHLIDGIEELERFTQTYDDYYLHTGRELFNLAMEISQLAASMVAKSHR